MCGITGFVGHHNRDLLTCMNRTLVRRGPDEEGYYWDPEVGLAMRRLSIIDVQSGHQPIANETDSVWTVFNGEIYNFQELRSELEKKGHSFKTDHSDTETIVHAYEEYGEEFVKHLDGMFAIAVWDCKMRQLLLYRDRLGEKPLYYHSRGNSFFFASEIKAILALPFFRRELNEKALFYYLSLKHVPREACFFQGIQSLGPGEYLRVRRNKIVRKIYWEIDASRVLKIGEEEACGEIRSLLKRSVQYRMISDVPLGAYLSGGVDSSGVVGLMSQIRKTPMDTFSLTYEDALPDKEQDRVAAFQMAEKFGTKHHEYQLGFGEFVKEWPQFIRALDEPFGGTVSTFFLSKLIRKHVKVAISGDGADELFGSYRVHRLAYPIARLNHFISEGIQPDRLSAVQRRSLAPFSDEIDYLLKIREKYPYQWHTKLSVYSDEEKRLLLEKRWAKKTTDCSTLEYYRRIYSRAKSDDALNQVLQVECQNLLPDHVLYYVDRLSMAHSIEVRPPFLDHRFVEFVFRLPGKIKIKEGENKYALKKAMRRLLPESIIRRPKEGFILPYLFWMKHYLYDKINDLLSEQQLKRHGCFNVRYVQKLVEDYQGGKDANANKIYLLLNFQIWWNEYFN